MNNGDLIQIGIMVLTFGGFVVTIISLKKDNRKSNEETIEKTIKAAISEVTERAKIEKRISLLEQKVNMTDDATKKELDEIKNMLKDIIMKFEKHANEK